MILKAPQQGFPVTADWGRSVVDAICRLRLRAGPGIKITQTPEGTTVSAPAPSRERDEPLVPQAFQVRTRPDGEGTVEVAVWLVPDGAEAVRRNGWPVAPQGAYVVAEPGWVSFGMGIPVSATPAYVVLRCKWDSPTLSKPSGWAGDLYWTIGIETLTAAAAIDRFETPVILASIVDGVARQIHVGAAETWCTLADSEVDAATDHQSLGWRGDLPADTDGHFLELFQFCQMEQIAAIDLSAVFSGSADPDHDLNILIRTWDAASSTARLDYSTLDGLMDEYARSDPTTGEFVTWLDEFVTERGDGNCQHFSGSCPFNAAELAAQADPPTLVGPLVFDPVNGEFVETSGQWWEQGGSEASCYGSAVGNSAKAKVIDLDGPTLVGDWAVSAAGSFTIPTSAAFNLNDKTVASTIININGSSYELLELV